MGVLAVRYCSLKLSRDASALQHRYALHALCLDRLLPISTVSPFRTHDSGSTASCVVSGQLGWGQHLDFRVEHHWICHCCQLGRRMMLVLLVVSHWRRAGF